MFLALRNVRPTAEDIDPISFNALSLSDWGGVQAALHEMGHVPVQVITGKPVAWRPVLQRFKKWLPPAAVRLGPKACDQCTIPSVHHLDELLAKGDTELQKHMSNARSAFQKRDKKRQGHLLENLVKYFTDFHRYAAYNANGFSRGEMDPDDPHGHAWSCLTATCVS